MLKFKACPRCQGDLELERNEMHEVEVYCLQCGFRKFERISASPVSAKLASVRAFSRPLPDVSKPRVPGDHRSRRGGVHRRVLTAV